MLQRNLRQSRQILYELCVLMEDIFNSEDSSVADHFLDDAVKQEAEIDESTVRKCDESPLETINVDLLKQI